MIFKRLYLTTSGVKAQATVKNSRGFWLYPSVTVQVLRMLTDYAAKKKAQVLAQPTGLDKTINSWMLSRS